MTTNYSHTVQRDSVSACYEGYVIRKGKYNLRLEVKIRRPVRFSATARPVAIYVESTGEEITHGVTTRAVKHA